MTDIDPNTFTGPNQGNDNGYIPYTTISQAKIDADFNNIKTDLDKLLATLQSAYSKLDTIETGATADLTAEEITALINASQYRIDLDNLDTDVVSSVELNSGIETHRTTTNTTYMHPETSIKNTGLTYSNTPSSIKTSCANLLDEIKNLRFQIHKLNGKANWSDTPDNNIKSLTSNLQALNNDLSNHSSDLSKHLTADQNAAIDGANVPSGTNVFATMNDVGTAGYGDMFKSVYDTDDDGIVDNADALDGAHLSDIQNEIDSDISTHKSDVDAHHAKYTDAEAQAAINNDTDHGSTAAHNYFSGNYNDLSNKPSIAYASTIPADALTSGQVSNLQSNVLADGSQPWQSDKMPMGAIIMWSGLSTEIPTGWQICDGTNGTPDLRNRFVVGAGDTYTNGDTGGESEHTLTVDEMPPHNHSYIYDDYGENAINNGNHPYVADRSNGTNYVSTEGGGQPHENRPPYYALYYIMKIS